METLRVELKNCYGIKDFSHEFDFTRGSLFLIYASNATMKTSFAKVFGDIVSGSQPADRVFPNRSSSYSITDESGTPLSPEQVFVVDTSQDSYTSPRMATLLANATLRKEFEAEHKAIDDATDPVIRSLSNQAHRRDVDEELTSAFGRGRNELVVLLEELHRKVANEPDNGFAFINYADMFNEKVVSLLAAPDILKGLNEYMTKYNELLEKSAYFRRGIFNHWNASTIAANLKKNHFFQAKHSIVLADSQNKKEEIDSDEALQRALGEEMRKILNDKELEKRFNSLDKSLSGNEQARFLRDLLESHPELVAELDDLGAFKQKVWVSYLHQCGDELSKLVETYVKSKRKIEEVIEKAKTERTLWERTVEDFNRRFFVPFAMSIANLEDVMLREHAASVVFEYVDGGERATVAKEGLLNVLSTGERRAMYLLNVLFELRARSALPFESVIVFDDVADSFDYKNKYAIVQYLKEIKEESKFRVIVLTHNFDFFRTVQSRLNVDRETCVLMAIRHESAIGLVQAQYLNAFRTWKQNCSTNLMMAVALIPLARNVVEYSKGTAVEEYERLTSVLHQKPDTDTLTTEDITSLLHEVLGVRIDLPALSAVEFILRQAMAVPSVSVGINLENKIVLAIATRLAAERFMISRIADPSRTDGISGVQTYKLLEMFRQLASATEQECAIMDEVVLMTPESIHLNSFMYEPILDMSDDELLRLFHEVREICQKESVWPAR